MIWYNRFKVIWYNLGIKRRPRKENVMSIIGGKCMSNVRRCIFVIIVLSAQFTFTMPDKDEIKLVQPMVLELMSTHEKNFNAKKETAKEVGDAAVSFADKADGEAAKYILLKGAIDYYALAKEYDLAADTLESLRASVKDLPAEDMAAIASRALNRARQGEAQRLRTISRIASMRAKAETDVKACKSVLRKKPDDKDALNGLADAYVRLDDWPKALKVFLKLGNNAAAFELNPTETKDFDSLKAADYWWDFKPKDAEPYRTHAAVLYKTAMGEGLVKGLKQPLVEKRIAEAEARGLTSTSLDGKGGQAADVPGARSSGKTISTELATLKELVSNGTFEANTVPDGSYDTSTAITSWSKIGTVALIRKNANVSWKQKNDETTMCFINSGASISQIINVPERMNCVISLKKANKNYYNNGKKFYSTTGCVKIDDSEVISKLATDGGNTRSFSANVELTPGPHTLTIACTSGHGRGMSIDDVMMSRTSFSTASDSRTTLPEEPQVTMQKEPTVQDEPTEGAIDDLQKKLNDNLAELKKLVDKNPACYLNPSSTSIINVSKRIATAKDRRYCSCINVTLVRDMFYCSGCKRVRGMNDSPCCNVSRKQSYYRWMMERKKVDETSRINSRIDELYTENESLEKQIRSMKRSRPGR